jgi:hypothetical protein
MLLLRESILIIRIGIQITQNLNTRAANIEICQYENVEIFQGHQVLLQPKEEQFKHKNFSSLNIKEIERNYNNTIIKLSS